MKHSVQFYIEKLVCKLNLVGPYTFMRMGGFKGLIKRYEDRINEKSTVFDFLENMKHHPGTVIVHTFIQDNATGAPDPEDEPYEFQPNDPRVKLAKQSRDTMAIIKRGKQIDIYIWFYWIDDRNAWLAGKRRNPHYARY